jgi:hypothetical protein
LFGEEFEGQIAGRRLENDFGRANRMLVNVVIVDESSTYGCGSRLSGESSAMVFRGYVQRLT